MNRYFQQKTSNKAVLGPFKKNPFSPLNSLPQKDTSERRVILDLIFPKGFAVNDFISKEEYLGGKWK